MTQTFFTHDNGGRPFKVVVDDEKKEIIVYEEDGVIDDTGEYINEYPHLTLKIPNYEKIFIGESDGDFGLGNSILIHLNNNKYLYIGGSIYEFTTNDKIINYESPIGNSDVPYPYAIGEKHTYLMIEDVMIDNENLKTTDPYDHYYNHSKKFNDVQNVFNKFEPKTIRERIENSKEQREKYRAKLEDYEKRKKLLDKQKKADTKKAGAKKTGVKKTGVKKTGVKKTGAKKTGAKKAGAKKTGVKKTGVRKTEAKKTNTD